MPTAEELHQRPEKTTRRLSGILSADAVEYSRLMARDEDQTIRSLKAARNLLGGLTLQHGGRVVDAVGDNLLVDFGSVVDAVACAVAFQNELAKRNEDIEQTRQMRFRIGINLGDVVVDGDEIYGDGVNIASRIQALTEPGGVSVSGGAYEQVAGKLGLRFEDLGECQVKNIPRPVRVYNIEFSDEHETAVRHTVPGFAGRPAIAVLPFDNISEDPNQAYLADGLTEDLITRLSAWRRLPVIARNSTFVYRGAVNVQQVSRELGVRYVVEGSVQKTAERVRVSAQLIDATSGHHVVAARYDQELRDLFELQDEVTERIVEAIEPEIRQYEPERAARQDPSSLEAWDCVQRAVWHLMRYTRADNQRADSWLGRASQLAPFFAPAQYFSALNALHAVFYGWTDSPAKKLDAALVNAERAAALDGNDSAGHSILGVVCLFFGQVDRSLEEHRRAIELDPSFALAYWGLGQSLVSAGRRPHDAIAMIEKAIRLSPADALTNEFLADIALAQFQATRYEDALASARRSLQLSRGASAYRAWPLLVSSYSQLGRAKEASAALAEAEHISLATIETLLGRITGDAELKERLLEGLRKAGLSS